MSLRQFGLIQSYSSRMKMISEDYTEGQKDEYVGEDVSCIQSA
jgi:hypothetical protein